MQDIDNEQRLNNYEDRRLMKQKMQIYYKEMQINSDEGDATSSRQGLEENFGVNPNNLKSIDIWVLLINYQIYSCVCDH